jgi:hypothetical protein
MDRSVTNRTRLAVLAATLGLAALAAGQACKKGGAAAEDPTKQLAAQLGAAAWVGKIGEETVSLTFRDDGGTLQAELVFTYFGKPGVKETLAVELEAPGLVTLTGTSYERLAGAGDFILDKLVGSLLDDGKKFTGRNSPEGLEPTSFSLVAGANLADIDPPLDLAAAEAALLNGKWEGKLGDMPAKLAVTKEGGKLTAAFEYGEYKSLVAVQIADTGTVTMTAPERPTDQGLMTETFTGQLHWGLSSMHGEWEVVVKQGFVEQASGERFVLIDLTKREARPGEPAPAEAPTAPAAPAAPEPTPTPT